MTVVTTAIQEANGVTPTWTTITAGRFMTKDQYTVSGSYPIKIPSADFKYSYWKHHALYYSAGDETISNINFFSDGDPAWALGTGGYVLVARRDAGDNGCPAGNYQEATGGGHVEGDTGPYLKEATNGHTYYKGQTIDPINVGTYTSGGTQLLIDSGSYTTVGQRSKSVVTQLKVAPDATQGLKSTPVKHTLRYDEA